MTLLTYPLFLTVLVYCLDILYFYRTSLARGWVALQCHVFWDSVGFMCCLIVFGYCLCVCLFALCSVSTSSFQHAHFFLLWECRHYNSDFFHYSSELDFVLYARYTLYFRRALFNLNGLYMLSIGSCVRVLAKFVLSFQFHPWVYTLALTHEFCIKDYYFMLY